MAQQADIEKDPFLVLLTDALRAGPGSPEWRDAVAKIKAGGQGVDEYRMLVEAREALESGKDYRSVRAGAGFTKKLLTNLENEQPVNKRSLPLAGIIAVIAGVVILSVLAVVGYQLYPRGGAPAGNTKAIDELASTYLPTQVLSSTFEKSIPADWRKIGNLSIDATDGLRAGAATVAPGEYSGGGIVTSTPIPADQTVSMQVMLNIKTTGEDLIPQAFVSNSPDFSQERAISAQELVWELKGKDQNVAVSGRVTTPTPLLPHTQTLMVRIILSHDLGIVEADGHRLWAGPNALGDQPRYLGIRFIRTDGKNVADVSIQSVRVQKS